MDVERRAFRHDIDSVISFAFGKIFKDVSKGDWGRFMY